MIILTIMFILSIYVTLKINKNNDPNKIYKQITAKTKDNGVRNVYTQFYC